MSKLLPMLLEGRLVAKKPPRKNPPRFPGFDENQSCAFHMGEKGHTVDNCLTLKYEIQALIDGGVLEFDKSEPNVQQNPLPEHKEVNVVIEGERDENPHFVIDQTKMTAILEKAAAYPAGRKATEEEKRQCLEKLMSLGVITQADNTLEGSTCSSFDLSSDKVILKADKAEAQITPDSKEVVMSTDRAGPDESEDELEKEEERLERIRRGDRRFIQEAIERGAVIDTLGQDSGRYNFKVLYSPPPWAFMQKEEIVPDGWDGMDDPENDGIVGAIDGDVPDYEIPRVEDVNHLERDQALHLRLSILEKNIVRLTHAISRATRAVANIERPAVAENPYIYEVRKMMDWLTRYLISLERKSKNAANTATELI